MENLKDKAKTYVEDNVDLQELKRNIQKAWEGVDKDFLDEEECNYVVRVETIVSDHWGWKATAKACEVFGLITEEQFNKIENGEETDEFLHDTLDNFCNYVSDELNACYPELKGTLYFEWDGDFYLAYSQDYEELYDCPHCGGKHTPDDWDKGTEEALGNKKTTWTDFEAVKNSTMRKGYFFFCPETSKIVQFEDLELVAPDLYRNEGEKINESVREFSAAENNLIEYLVQSITYVHTAPTGGEDLVKEAINRYKERSNVNWL